MVLHENVDFPKVLQRFLIHCHCLSIGYQLNYLQCSSSLGTRSQEPTLNILPKPILLVDAERQGDEPKLFVVNHRAVSILRDQSDNH